jgi:hypothetical protein
MSRTAVDPNNNIYYTTTASPQVPGTVFGTGQCPHLADGISYGGLLNPQIVFVQTTQSLCTSFTEQAQAGASIESNYLQNTSSQAVPVDAGVWSSVNNSGGVVYQTTNSNTSPIWFAGNANGVDLSDVPSISWNEILTVYAPRFVVADAWGGVCKRNVTPCRSSFHPHDILSGALLANPNIPVAAYAVLNLNSGAPSPSQQMQYAITAVGNLKSSLKFMAIDLEGGLYSSSTQSQNVSAIVQAIDAVRTTYGLKPVIYTSANDWKNATGNDVTIGGCGTGGYCVPIWNARYDHFPDLFDDKSATAVAPWQAVGGWSQRLGKQYNDF